MQDTGKLIKPHILLFSCSVVFDSLVTPWIVACQAPLSMEFPRQEYWSGLLFPSPRDFLNPRIKPTSPTLACGLYATELPWKLGSLSTSFHFNLQNKPQLPKPYNWEEQSHFLAVRQSEKNVTCVLS